ncbi:MAG: N-acetyl-gamma-glutamyl-phosphate reductase [Chitinophagaceae bacterium]|nr:N-acetyl-gamma-glutamyl-phosphate reductase [Chitinophagaceae bacterium]
MATTQHSTSPNSPFRGPGGIKAGIVGGAGYTGGEMIRLLLNHPYVEIAFVHSTSNAGNPVARIHADLTGDTDLLFSDQLSDDIDVLFLCVGHGDARKFLSQHKIDDSVKIIDLSQDFRLKASSKEGARSFVYGLPELNREEIRTAKNIANPGCFATAIQLGLLPLAKAGGLHDVYTTGITGSTGAGQGLNATSHFSWRANNVQAYKTLQHQHINEIHQSLEQLQGNQTPQVHFVPWRGDFTRGIYITSTIDSTLSLEELNQLYRNYYESHPFTHVSNTMIDLKQVVNTNKCLIHLEKHGNKLAVHSAIDNLLKGASGQAVQNMNLLFGLDEAAGLRLKANWF